MPLGPIKIALGSLRSLGPVPLAGLKPATTVPAVPVVVPRKETVLSVIQVRGEEYHWTENE